MKKLITTTFLFLVLFFSRGYSQINWSPSFVDMVFNLKAVTFIDENTGFIAGMDNEQYGGTVLKTTNGGLSWSHYYTKSGELKGLSFPSAETGYACSEDGSVSKTSDNGYTWLAKNVHSSFLNSIYFTDNNTGFVVGSQGAIYKTVNGGTIWNLYNVGLGLILTGVYFTDANTGYVCGYNPGLAGSSVIIKTVNAGATWTIRQVPYNKLNKIFFLDENTGFVIGVKPGNAIWKTTNGGQSWVEKYAGFSAEPHDLFFTSSYLGIVVASNGLIFRTINGGGNWVQDNSFSTNDLYGVWITGNNKGYIVGMEGIILKTNSIPDISCGTHKVYICHNNHTICVDTHAVKAHLDHGDYLGQCNNSNEQQLTFKQTPDNFKLYTNYPNPFNPATKIMFDLPYDANTRLTIYDAAGREVARLVDNFLIAGNYEYEWNAVKYASGIYYYKLEAGYYKDIMKMVLVK
jgi:photosystem II stability/assembly factor-like uncharacterized protein